MATPSMRRTSCATMYRQSLNATSACRRFSTSIPRPLNPLMNLSGLANSKESQYLSKERKIPRIEFSPYLELIRSSEVDIFAPAPGASPTVIAALQRAQRGESDMQTAYSLALSNLLQQLETSKQETRAATQSLAQLYEKHRTQEKQALAMALLVITIVSLMIFRPDFMDEVRESVADVKAKWTNFDLLWLGNTPAHRIKSAQTSSTKRPREPSSQAATHSPFQPIEVTDDALKQRATSVQTFVAPSTVYSSWWSRLFWAT